MADIQQRYDLFISHASEDKETFVRPLATALANLGLAVWFDEFSLRVGDSLSRSIDRGLAGSQYGLVIISAAFIAKAWPEYELRGLVAREIAAGRKVILPIWHGVSRDVVLNFSPTLADKVALNTSDLDPEAIALQILQEVRPDIYQAHPRAELQKIASGEAMDELRMEIEGVRFELEKATEQLSEYQCPTCGSRLESKAVVPLNDEHGSDFLFERFECGCETSDGRMIAPCPHDPRYPNPEDYELQTVEGPPGHWTSFAKPRTPFAHLVSVWSGTGRTQEEAESDIKKRLPRRRTKG